MLQDKEWGCLSLSHRIPWPRLNQDYRAPWSLPVGVLGYDVIRYISNITGKSPTETTSFTQCFWSKDQNQSQSIVHLHQEHALPRLLDKNVPQGTELSKIGASIRLFQTHYFIRSSICSTPNPYPSPIRQVGVSIIIVKIYYSLSTLPYSPVKHLCRKNSIAEPPFEILTSNFLGYVHIGLT